MTREQIIDYAYAAYGAAPDYRWRTYPRYFVLRRPGNRKWFALVMDVPLERLGLPGTGRTDIMDVKCGPILKGSFLGRPGILPAYHMNKDHWLSLRLDTAAREDIEALLAFSYDLVK